jgi:hypothetical protein
MMSTIDLSSGRAVDTMVVEGKLYHRPIGDHEHITALIVELGSRAFVDLAVRALSQLGAPKLGEGRQ